MMACVFPKKEQFMFRWIADGVFRAVQFLLQAASGLTGAT